jgi:hypothetical protein
VSQCQQPQDTETTDHLEDVEMIATFNSEIPQDERYPEGYYSQEIQSIKGMAQEGAASKLEPLLILKSRWHRLLTLHKGRERASNS